MRELGKSQAAKIIEEHLRSLATARPKTELLVSAREAGRRMVEIYRLLTGEMPQACFLEEVGYQLDELPGVEFTSPLERDPSEVCFVHPGFGNEPDVLVKGDQNGEKESSSTRKIGAKISTLLGPYKHRSGR